VTRGGGGKNEGGRLFRTPAKDLRRGGCFENLVIKNPEGLRHVCGTSSTQNTHILGATEKKGGSLKEKTQRKNWKPATGPSSGWANSRKRIAGTNQGGIKSMGGEGEAVFNLECTSLVGRQMIWPGREAKNGVVLLEPVLKTKSTQE